MRRDLLITALVFAILGFIGGYVYSQKMAGAAATGAVGPGLAGGGNEASNGKLPEGHPPLDVAQRWRALEQAAQENPRDAKAALDLANFLYDNQRWDEAVNWYGKALALQPNDANAVTDRGTAYFHMSKFDQALADYSRALKIEPNKPQALYGLALARLHGKQDTAGARKAYEQLKRTHPEFPGVELLAKQLESDRAKP